MRRPSLCGRGGLAAGVRESAAAPHRTVVRGRATRCVGRDARTGRFIPLAVARRRRATSVVETVPLPKRRRRWS